MDFIVLSLSTPPTNGKGEAQVPGALKCLTDYYSERVETHLSLGPEWRQNGALTDYYSERAETPLGLGPPPPE